MLLRRDGVVNTDVPNAKVYRAKVKAGDAFILRSGGGGGFGSPLERPAQDVQQRRQAGLRVAGGGARLLRRRSRSRHA